MFVQHQADTYYILLVEVVHSRIFDEALLASIATKVAQAFEDALEAIKQVCVRGMWSFSTFSSIHHTNCIIMCSKLMEKQKFSEGWESYVVLGQLISVFSWDQGHLSFMSINICDIKQISFTLIIVHRAFQRYHLW